MATKKSKKEKDQKLVFLGLLLLAAVGFALAGIALGFSFNLDRLYRFKPRVEKTPILQPATKAVFSLNPSEATKMTGEKLQIAFLVGEVKKEISGIAVRVSCSWGLNSTPIEFIDVNPNKLGTQLEVNQELINAGWAFPVNQIDSQEGFATLDLAAVYVSPDGFKVEKKTSLANFYFTTIKGGRALSCNFDPAQTKIISKTGEEISLNFEKGDYLILE